MREEEVFVCGACLYQRLLISVEGGYLDEYLRLRKIDVQLEWDY